MAGIAGWDDIRDALHGEGWGEIRSVVIDSATKAEEVASDWVPANIPHEKGHKVQRLTAHVFGGRRRSTDVEPLRPFRRPGVGDAQLWGLPFGRCLPYPNRPG